MGPKVWYNVADVSLTETLFYKSKVRASTSLVPFWLENQVCACLPAFNGRLMAATPLIANAWRMLQPLGSDTDSNNSNNNNLNSSSQQATGRQRRLDSSAKSSSQRATVKERKERWGEIAKRERREKGRGERLHLQLNSSARCVIFN